MSHTYPSILTSFRILVVVTLTVSATAIAGDTEPVNEPVPETIATPVSPSWLLRYQFRQGGFFHFHSRSSSTMEVSAREITQLLSENRETFKHFRVVAVDKDGSAVLEPMIDRAIMKARADDGPWIIWDSRSTQLVPKRFQTVAENVGKATVRVRYQPTGEIEEVLPAPGKKQEDLNPDKSTYSFLVRLPDEAVSVGDTWNDDFVVQVSPEPDLSRRLRKDIDIRRVYKLTKVENGIAEITFRTFVRKPVRDPIIEAQLISRSLNGTVKFELKRGIILEWASTGSGQVFNPYGNSSSIRTGLRSLERFSAKPLASLKPVAATGPPRAATEPGRPVIAGPARRPKF